MANNNEKAQHMMAQRRWRSSAAQQTGRQCERSSAGINNGLRSMHAGASALAQLTARSAQRAGAHGMARIGARRVPRNENNNNAAAPDIALARARAGARDGATAETVGAGEKRGLRCAVRFRACVRCALRARGMAAYGMRRGVARAGALARVSALNMAHRRAKGINNIFQNEK